MTLTSQRPLDRAVMAEPQHDDLSGVVVAARQLVGAAVDVPTFGLGDDALVTVLADVVALRSQVDELASRLAVELDVRGTARDHGASSTAGYLASLTGTSRGLAATMVVRGRLLTARSEPTRLAWARGDLTGEQAEVIARAVARLGTDCSDDAVERGQHDLAPTPPG